MRLFAPLLCVIALTAALHAQSGPFAAYEHCHFADGLAVVETTPLAEGVEGRTVKTVMGNKDVPLAGGTRLLFAYPQTEPFANVKIEQVPEDGYSQARQDLIANFEQILTADDSSTRNYALKPRVNGLEIYGLDRRKLEGSTLGIYLFFVDRTHTVTTIYFLNQDPRLRKFSSLEEYAKLRDSFVQTVTACVAGRAAPPATKVAAARHTAHAAAPPAPVAATEAPPSAPLPNAPAPQGIAAAPEAPATTGVAASQTTDSYVPPEAAPLVHPRNAADRKAAAKTAAKSKESQTGTKKTTPAAVKPSGPQL